MLATTNWNSYIRLLSCITSQARDERIHFIVRATTIIEERVVGTIPGHTTKEFTRICLRLAEGLHYADIFIRIRNSNVNVILAVVIEWKFCHIGLNKCTWLVFKEERTGHVFHCFKINFMPFRSTSLCIIKNWLRYVPNYILFWNIHCLILKLSCHLWLY